MLFMLQCRRPLPFPAQHWIRRCFHVGQPWGALDAMENPYHHLVINEASASDPNKKAGLCVSWGWARQAQWFCTAFALHLPAGAGGCEDRCVRIGWSVIGFGAFGSFFCEYVPYFLNDIYIYIIYSTHSLKPNIYSSSPRSAFLNDDDFPFLSSKRWDIWG